jgi:hypothetical protein
MVFIAIGQKKYNHPAVVDHPKHTIHAYPYTLVIHSFITLFRLRDLFLSI